MSILRGVATTLLLRRMGAVLSHTTVAAAMAVVWVRPMAFGSGFPGDLELLLMMEFVILHSTAFLVAFRFVKEVPGWITILMYAPFAIVIGSMVSSWVVVLFFWHLASGIWGDFDTADRSVGIFLLRYVPTFVWFAVLPFAVVLLGLSALGWEDYPRLAFRLEDGRSYPGLVPAWATLYFAGRALWEVAIRYWERTGGLDRLIAMVRST